MLTLPPFYNHYSSNGGISPRATPWTDRFNDNISTLANRVSSPAGAALGFTVTSGLIISTIIVPLAHVITYVVVTVASVAIPVFCVDQLIKAYVESKYKRTRRTSSHNVRNLRNTPSREAEKKAQVQHTHEAKRIEPRIEKKVEFSDATKTWLSNCGIASYTSAEAIERFNQSLIEFKKGNYRSLSPEDQLALFERTMDLKNVRMEDFKTFKEWSKLTTPPEKYADDKVLKNCLCAITLEYPEKEAIYVPAYKNAIYDKDAINHRLNTCNNDQTRKDLAVDQQQKVPEIESIIKYRLFELAILNKQSWF